MSAPKPLLRDLDGQGGHAPVGHIELFFDLVYVFAVTQLSHHLLAHPKPIYALETAIMFGAVWWAWIYTTWATNWLDPDRTVVRLMLGFVMLGSLAMSSAIAKAFDGHALIFAGAYVAIQVGRTAFSACVVRGHDAKLHSNLSRATIWFLVSAPLWIGGALAGDAMIQIGCWIAALAIEATGPAFGFPVPGMGRTATRDWSISGAHMAERCALFIIIALGESIIVTGTTFAEAGLPADMTAGFVTAVVGSFAMWWIYFDIGAKRGAQHIEEHADPGRVARDAYTYWHMAIVAGIVIVAVTDAMTLERPADQADATFLVLLVTGCFLFLGGTMVFKRISSQRSWWPLSHLIGLMLIAVMAGAGFVWHPTTLAMSIASVAIFVFVAVWEWVSLHGGWVERLERRGVQLPGWLDRRARARLAVLEGDTP